MKNILLIPATKLEKLNFLNKTALHYNSRNRGAGKHNSCSYARGCAVGRHIRNKKLCAQLDKRDNSGVSYVFDELPLSLRKYGKAFLARVQMLHDSEQNWNADGITDVGLAVWEGIAKDVLKEKI